VDKKKLEKAQAKLQQKQDKRTEQVVRGVGTMSVANSKMDAATASQVTSKKEAKLEAKGNNRATDIRIENFDVAYGERYKKFYVIFNTSNFAIIIKLKIINCQVLSITYIQFN